MKRIPADIRAQRRPEAQWRNGATLGRPSGRDAQGAGLMASMVADTT